MGQEQHPGDLLDRHGLPGAAEVLGDLPLLELADGLRIVLLPTAGSGCALIGVNVAFLK